MVEFIIRENKHLGKRRVCYYYKDGEMMASLPSDDIQEVANFIYILTNAKMQNTTPVEKPKPLTSEEERYLEKLAERQREEQKLREYLENYEEDEEVEDEVLDYKYT